MSPELREKIRKARVRTITPMEFEAHQIGFAYGNARIENPKITRETVVRASKAIREGTYPSGR